MKLSFEIVLYDRGRAASLYTVRFEDEEQSELEFFLNDPDCQENPDFQPLVNRLKKGPHERGFRPNWFRDEEGVWALWAPYPKDEAWTSHSPALRLYCIRLPDLLIAGYGGVKTTRTFQEDDRLLNAVRDMQYVDERLHERRQFGGIWVENRELCGRLTFDREDVL